MCDGGSEAAGSAALAALVSSGGEGWFRMWPDREFFSFQLARVLGSVGVGNAEFSEVYAAAAAIGPDPNPTSFRQQFQALAEDTLARAKALEQTDPIGAGRLHLRAAASYLRTLEFFISPKSQLRAKVEMFQRMRSSFAFYAQTSELSIEPVRVPMEGRELYGYWVRPATEPPTGSYPAVICYGGLDSVGEELFLRPLPSRSPSAASRSCSLMAQGRERRCASGASPHVPTTRFPPGLRWIGWSGKPTSIRSASP